MDTTVVRTAAQKVNGSAGDREVGLGRLAGFDVMFFEKRIGDGAASGYPYS
jgi:hypothetical protein